VTRKAQADLLAILDTYAYFSQDHARNIITDVRLLLDEEVVDHIKFVWTAVGSSRVLDELEYVVIAAGIGLADDRAGGIRYRSDLAGADFHVRVTYNTRWAGLDATEKAAIAKGLCLKWGECDQNLWR